MTTYLPRGREDFYFLIDHGWQTKELSERTLPGAIEFFSLVIDARDFPPYAGHEPREALRLLNEEVKSHGWRGLGIWVKGNLEKATCRKFVEWSQYAGIEYWKIDKGDSVDFYCQQIKEEIYPRLTLEYANGVKAPLNLGFDDPNRSSYPSVYVRDGIKFPRAFQILRNADVFRTYDSAPLLVSTTTMRRVHDILIQTQNQEKYVTILNVQDDPQVAAGLGSLVGAMRHPNYMERTYLGEDFHYQISGKRMNQRRMNEIERFGRWQRIAPAFAAGIGTYRASEEELLDNYRHTVRDTHRDTAHGKMVYQSAPAIMSRNMPLPKVEIDGDPPYVMASKYPNGPVGVATEGRVKPGDQWYHPRANISIEVNDMEQFIGIFGHYLSLTLSLKESTRGIVHIWAQDLLAEEAVDVRHLVKIGENSITIPGALIDRIGTSAGDKGDISVPGMVIKIQNSSD
ncbi:MAG: hypothetical protein OQJ84_09495 [Xanthomonadales bacterium]|nr:hypothetical protein [Xanthomonadales bacterium]